MEVDPYTLQVENRGESPDAAAETEGEKKTGWELRKPDNLV